MESRDFQEDLLSSLLRRDFDDEDMEKKRGTIAAKMSTLWSYIGLRFTNFLGGAGQQLHAK